ncbi:PREDICTED: uncharacterized protein LOC109478995 [Branchiostoma belcheri]|uniref:Uncharacterized protein LOC109478995 n=1 Tax=Branchiostoma belcheri TaxID=7741 RepID=A0A6P5A3R9_BRABE|nr:PREDICTED: uncharacterized protein LOC109478995 [Branchiostoma belcheri]
MSSDKLTYGRLVPERGTRGRRERTGGLPGSWVALLLGAGAVVASAAVVAVILQNIGHEMGDLRARVERGQEDIAKLQARAESAERDLKEAQARAERDQSKLLQEIMSLRERVVVLETQTLDGSLPPSHAEQQTPDTGPVSNPEGDSSDINTGVQSRNDTLGGHLYRHKREAPNANWVRLPAITCGGVEAHSFCG